MFAGNETPPDARMKLGQIVDAHEQSAALRAEIQATNTRSVTLFQDQERLRENIKALRDSREERDLRKRYLDQLSRQEDQLQSSRAHIETVNQEAAAVEKRLADLIFNLSWGE